MVGIFKGIYLFAFGDLHQLEYEIEITINAMQMLVDNQETALNSVKESFSKKILVEKESSKMSDEEWSEYYSQVRAHEGYVITELAYTQRSASFLIIYSYFEGKLREICNMIHKECKLSKKPASKGDIESYWRYLTVTYKMNVDKVKTSFEPFRQKTAIRNRLTHNNGFMNNDAKDGIVKSSGLKFIPFGDDQFQIVISDVRYLHKSINDMSIFFKHLLLAIDKRYKEINKS